MLRAFQWDLARQVERLDWLVAQLPRYAEWGYQELYLHLEDAVEYPSLPSVARADAYTFREFERLVTAATRTGIKVVPIVNLLGHTQYLIKTPELRDLNELLEPDGTPSPQGQICPVHPRSMEIAEKLLRDMAPFCTAGKVHVGLDESFHLGKHPLSQAEIREVGLPAHFARYVTRLRNLTYSLGLRMGMWADMLYFLPEAVPLLPTDVAMYEWYYYSFSRRPRVELFNFAESELGERLRARGHEYWGCPMNGAFRFEPLPHFSDRLGNILSWWTHCRRLNATGLLVTSWEPYRLAIELTTVIDAAAASLWLDGVDDPRAMLERGFARVFGGPKRRRGGSKTSVATPARAAGAALACDRHPFSGYPRWEINAGWDVVSRRESPTEYRREARHFARLLRQGRNLPAPLRDSIALRWYFAERDAWVREQNRAAKSQARGAVTRARAKPFQAALREGLAAARAIWARTRDAHVAGPNEQILREDERRLRSLLRGQPVLGPQWQLCYRVHNVAPCVQRVSVEQQRPDGSWQVLQSCHTIEFQTRAATPRGTIVREHAAPVDWDGNASRLPRLRMVLRGVGLVDISEVALIGVETLSLGKRKIRLGARPAKSGFPDLSRQWIVPLAGFRRPGRT